MICALKKQVICGVLSHLTLGCVSLLRTTMLTTSSIKHSGQRTKRWTTADRDIGLTSPSLERRTFCTFIFRQSFLRTAAPDKCGLHGHGGAARQPVRGDTLPRGAHASPRLRHGKEQNFRVNGGPFAWRHSSDEGDAVSLGMVGARGHGRGAATTRSHDRAQDDRIEVRPLLLACFLFNVVCHAHRGPSALEARLLLAPGVTSTTSTPKKGIERVNGVWQILCSTQPRVAFPWFQVYPECRPKDRVPRSLPPNTQRFPGPLPSLLLSAAPHRIPAPTETPLPTF